MKSQDSFSKSNAELIDELNSLQQKYNLLEYELRERQKELKLLYVISSLLEQPDLTLESILQQIVNTIPSAWQYPDETCARIVVAGKEYSTDNFKTTPWKLSRDIQINNTWYGVAEVYYLSKRPDEYSGPFFREEIELLKLIAERIGKLILRKLLETEFSFLFRESPVAQCIIGLTNNYLIREVNEKFEELTGLTQDELKGRNFTGINIFCREIFENRIVPLLNQTGKVQNFEYRFLNNNGLKKVGLLNVYRLTLPSNEDIAIIGINDVTELKETLYINEQNETTLQNLFTNLRESQEMAKLGNWEYDVRKSLFRFNDNFYKVFHSSLDEIGSYVMSPEEYATRFIPSHLHSIVAEEIQKALEASGNDYSRYFEHEILYANGGSGYIAVRLRIIKNSQGETVTIYGVNQDITEKVLREMELTAAKEQAESTAAKLNIAQLELVRSERLLNDVQSISKTGGWEYVVETQKMYWTPELFAIHELEYTPGINHIEKSVQCYLPDDREHIVKAFNDCISSGTGYLMEFPFVTCKGNHKWIRTRTQAVVENGIVERVIGSVIDITEQKKNRDQLIEYSEKLETMVEERTEKLSAEIELRKETERELTENRELLNLVFQYSNDWEVYRDRNYNLVYCSQSIEKIVGYTPEEFMSGSFEFINIVLPADADKIRERPQKVLKGEVFESVQVRCYHKKGHIVWVNVSGRPVYSNNEIIGARFSARDITDLINIQHEIEEKNKMLSELNITKDKFFSIIAHDLRNPFNSLIGYSELLKMNAAGIPYEKLLHFADLMNSSAKEAYTLLQNLLEWSRIQTGKITPNPVKIDSSDLINEVKMLYSPIAQTKEIEFVTNNETDTFVYVDMEMARTILRNLVSNAIKFTFPHGLVSISASRSGRNVLFEIADNGTGVAAGELQMLFRIDSKLSKFGTANEKGTGLGLILCKEFVELNHGKIWVESEFGKGSSFKFTLPLFSESN